jgi:hypothetical protein
MLDPASDGREPRSRALPRALAAACLAAVAALASSCNIIIDAGSYQVGGPCPSGDCATCGFTFASSTCGACVQSKCCDEADACHADASCAPLYECLTACTAADAACRNQCAAHHPVGDDAAAKSLEACLSDSARCGDACSTCGGLADWQSDTCASCVQKLCCDQAKACADDDVCAERQRCYRACTYPSCSIACDDQIAAAAATPKTSQVIETFDTCTNVGCGPSCAYGAQWACAGHFSWPAHTPGQKVKLTIDAYRFTTNEPFPGAQIVTCGGKDPTCAHPIGEPVQTDESGSWTLSLDSGFDGYFLVTAPDTMDALVFIAWPLTADQHYSLGLDSYEVYKSLVKSGGGTVKDEDGALFVFTYDCLLRSAPHVMLDIDAESKDPDGSTSHFFFVGSTPVSAIDETSPDGIGGFSNVLPKTVTITASLKREGKTPLPLAVLPVYTRAKTLTYVSLPPTP